MSFEEWEMQDGCSKYTNFSFDDFPNHCEALPTIPKWGRCTSELHSTAPFCWCTQGHCMCVQAHTEQAHSSAFPHSVVTEGLGACRNTQLVPSARTSEPAGTER